MSLPFFLILWSGLLGLVVGSYLNVVAHRLPRGESTVRPASRCPACGTPIRARDNVPVISYLLLGGRCRSCRTHIPLRYPALELACGLAFAGSVARFGFAPPAAVAALLSALLLVLMAIDSEHLMLPDWLTLPGTAAGIAATYLLGTPLRQSLVGAVVGAAILLLLIGAWWLVRRELAMGFGDVKMLAMIGAFLGWPGVAVTLVVASTAGAAVGLALLARRAADGKTKLPFGVFLGLGGFVALFFGDRLVGAYLGLL